MGLLKMESRLLVAIQNNDLEAAERLLQKGMDADVRFNVGAQERPAICLCVQRGNIEMTRLLLRWGCSINQYDAYGQTPLHIAASFSHPGMVALLYQNKANSRVVNSYGQTPLHLAATHNSLEIVRMLVDSCSEVDRRDHDGRTALAIACFHGNYKVAQFLTSKGADVNVVDRMGNTPLLQSVVGPHLDPNLVQLLIFCGAKVNVTNRLGDTPLLSVISHGPPSSASPEVVQMLLDAGSDLSMTTLLGQSALHLAVVHHQYTIVRQLVLFGASANTKDTLGLTPLFHLARSNQFSLVELLVDSGVNFRRETWIRDADLVSEIWNDKLMDWILVRSKEMLTLKNLVRICARQSMGTHIDAKISKLPLPACLKDYLGLQQM